MNNINNKLFVILSDIHISEKNNNEVIKRLDEFKIELDNLEYVYEKDNMFILIAGDIAFSGKSSEYELLKTYFMDFSKKYKVVICPGNHDHDFSVYKGAMREHLLNMSIDNVDENVINMVTDGQCSYRSFESEISNLNVFEKSNLASKYIVEDYLSIVSMNSAWCSTINEKGGSLQFPISDLIGKSDPSYFCMTFFHHPLSWLEPNNSKEVRNFLRENNDIIITGHEHIDDSFKVETDSNESLFIESASFYDTSIEGNGFLTISFDNNDVLINKYSWDKDCYNKSEEKRKSEIVKNNLISSLGYNLKPDFAQKLSDTGIVFYHPDIDDITLNDIFVYPNYKNLSSSKKTLERESSEGLLSKNGLNNIILIGDECCGKTTLLKRLYLDALHDNKIPILIDGDSIKKARNFKGNQLESIIKQQYSNLSLSKLIGINSQKIVLIDNFDYIKGDNKTCAIFISLLSKYFNKIIVTVSDTYDLGESYIKGNAIFDESYSKLEILKLGYRLRYELINKWNKRKSICEDSNKDLIFYNNLASKTINRIIGQNYIPSTPFFLLTMLQSMDSGNASDMNTSSYGYYYQYLITSSLGLASVKKENLDEIFNYITELSYYFYINKSKENSYDSLWDFNNTFCNQYGLKVDCKPRLDLLVKTKILNIKNECYSFKYPYIYYFFIAKYLSESLNDDSTSDIISKLVETLDKKRSMSILMFLTHHSKDKSILERIINHAKDLFKNFKPASLGDNIVFIDSIIEQLPEFNYKYTDRLELRKNIEDKKDKKDKKIIEYNKFEDEDEDVTNEESQNFDFLKELNQTFKSLELLGQLARNYYGSLKVDQKKQLLSEAIDAPLRALDGIFSAVQDEPESAIEMIESRLLAKADKQNYLSPSEVKNIARKILFELMTFVTYNVIKKVSSCIGSRNLLPVIESIAKDIDTNSVKLIELSTKLELGQGCPSSELHKLTKLMKNHRLCTVILKSMILNYMYMFELADKDVKQICHIAGINYKPVSDQINLDKIKNK